MELTIQQLITNVQDWARTRGIYEHSTFNAQMLKALSEAGELCDAVVKKDGPSIKDAVGDVMVCVINAAEMSSPAVAMDFRECVTDVDTSPEKPDTYKGLEAEAAYVCHSLGALFRLNTLQGTVPTASSGPSLALPHVAYTLMLIARHQGYTLRDALESAWKEIKNRKGRMVPGGAFVKDEEPKINPNQSALNLEVQP